MRTVPIAIGIEHSRRNQYRVTIGTELKLYFVHRSVQISNSKKSPSLNASLENKLGLRTRTEKVPASFRISNFLKVDLEKLMDYLV